MSRFVRGALLLTLLPLLGGCPTPVDCCVEPGASAEFYFALTISEESRAPRDSVPIRLDAELRPARNERGEDRLVPDPTLRIAGSGVAPTGVPYERYGYAYRRTLLAGEAMLLDSGISIEPPAVDGVQMPVKRLRYPIWRRADGSLQRVRAGAPVLLRLLASRDTTGVGAREWAVQVTGRDGESMRLGGPGAPPSILHIPLANFPSVIEGKTYRVHLEVTDDSERWGWASPGPYQVAGTVRISLEWILVVVRDP